MPHPLYDTRTWADEKLPDPTAEELGIGRAARRFATLSDAIEQHDGPRSGPWYAHALEDRESAWQDLLALAATYQGRG